MPSGFFGVFDPSATEFRVLDSQPNHFLFGFWKNVVVAAWINRATGPAVERLAHVYDVVSKLHTMRTTIHLIADGAGMPTPEARAVFVRLMREHAAQIGCVAVALEGSGFFSSALRSFITGMRLVVPRSYEFRVYETIDEVAGWVPKVHQKSTGVILDPHELRAVLKAARQAVAQPAHEAWAAQK